jgi:hypothetical protein
MLISTALLLDSNIRNSVCTPAKLPCRRVEVGYERFKKKNYLFLRHVVCKSIVRSLGCSFRVHRTEEAVVRRRAQNEATPPINREIDR